MHKHWCQHQFVFEKDAPTPKQGDEAATSPSPKSAKSSVARAKPVVQEALALSNDGILSYYNPKTKKTDVVDRAVLQKVRGKAHTQCWKQVAAQNVEPYRSMWLHIP